MGDELLAKAAELRYGDITDLSNYGGALIDQRAFVKNGRRHRIAKGAAAITVAVGGEYDDSEALFRAPHGAVSPTTRTDESFVIEYFGPLPPVHAYPDERYEQILDVTDTGSRYALTGAVVMPTTGRPC